MADGARAFVDTNILLYAHDATEAAKQPIARARLDELWLDGRGVISTQVLQEFYHVATRKLAPPIDRSEAREIIDLYSTWPVVLLDSTLILAATRLEEERQMSFWDALILEAARVAGADRLLTEDLQHGQVVEGVRIENPFMAATDPERDRGRRSKAEERMRTRTEQTEDIRADQQFWRDLVAEVGPDRYAESGPMGEWSFGDMAGHLLGWRSRTIARLEAAARGEPEPPNPWPAELDDDDIINVWIREHHAGRSPEQLVRDYDASYDRLVQALESLPDEKLTNPNAMPWAEGPLVEVDFTDHLHDEHVPSVRAWLDGVPEPQS